VEVDGVVFADGEAGHTVAEEFVDTVPFEMFPCWPKVLFVRELDLSALHGDQQHRSVAVFGIVAYAMNTGYTEVIDADLAKFLETSSTPSPLPTSWRQWPNASVTRLFCASSKCGSKPRSWQ
jgi:hypothetical protein